MQQVNILQALDMSTGMVGIDIHYNVYEYLSVINLFMHLTRHE